MMNSIQRSLIFVVLALAACDSKPEKEKSAEKTPSSTPSVTTSATTQAKAAEPVAEESTGAITTRIKEKYQVQNLMVIRAGTTIKLSGAAKSEADKKGAEEVARSSPGVTGVQNNITFGSTAPLE